MLGFATLSSGNLFHVHVYVMMILLLYNSSNSKFMLKNVHLSHNIASSFVYFCSTDEKMSTAHQRATHQWCFVTEWISVLNESVEWMNHDLPINRFFWFFPELIHQNFLLNDSQKNLIVCVFQHILNYLVSNCLLSKHKKCILQ